MDEAFLISQRDELRAQLTQLRTARDRLASAAMSAADEMARLERLEPGSVAEATLARSRRAQEQLVALDDQIKSLIDTLRTVEDRLAAQRETG